ncbi:MAG: signal transduction histidine kinase [Gammaproteobacteria bacterium]
MSVTIVVGVVVAVLVIGATLWQDRGRNFRTINLDHLAERITTTIRLLEDSSLTSRREILHRMQRRPFRIKLLHRLPKTTGLLPETNDSVVGLLKLLEQRLGNQILFLDVAAHRAMMHQSRLPLPDHMVGDKHPRLKRSDKSRVHLIVGFGDGSAVDFGFQLPSVRPELPINLLTTVGVLLFAVILVVWLVIRQISHPLDAIANHARNIGVDLKSPPMPEMGPDEVVVVDQSMNQMQRRLGELFEQRATFLAAVSHDLKTPITRLRLRSEFVEDDQLRQKFLRDLDDMEVMVQQTLEFLRDETAQEPIRSINLTAMLEAVMEDIMEATTARIVPELASAVIQGRPLALKRAITNVLQNAVQFGDEVSLYLKERLDFVEIIVIDNGPGIPDDQLSRVFEPFYRLDQSRASTGNGLGLSICQSIVSAHNGEIELSNMQPKGLKVRITIPKNPSNV